MGQIWGAVLNRNSGTNICGRQSFYCGRKCRLGGLPSTSHREAKLAKPPPMFMIIISVIIIQYINMWKYLRFSIDPNWYKLSIDPMEKKGSNLFALICRIGRCGQGSRGWTWEFNCQLIHFHQLHWLSVQMHTTQYIVYRAASATLQFCVIAMHVNSWFLWFLGWWCVIGLIVSLMVP